MHARLSLLLLAFLAAATGCTAFTGGSVPCDTDTDTDTETDTDTGSGSDTDLTAGSGSGSGSGSDSGASSSSSTGGASSEDTGADTEPADTDTDPGGSSGGDSESSGGESSSGGDQWCETNADCDESDVCSSEQCVDAWSVPHAVQVTAWDEPCDGAGTNMFFVEVGTFQSDTVGCPQGWPEDWFTVAAGGTAVAFSFYELGGAPNPDQLVTSWCWDSGMGCGPIPKAVLHAGFADESWDDWSASFSFEVVD